MQTRVASEQLKRGVLDVDAGGTKEGDHTKAGKCTGGSCHGNFPEWDGIFWKAV
jgi:hypothetical protein